MVFGTTGRYQSILEEHNVSKVIPDGGRLHNFLENASPIVINIDFLVFVGEHEFGCSCRRDFALHQDASRK